LSTTSTILPQEKSENPLPAISPSLLSDSTSIHNPCYMCGSTGQDRLFDADDFDGKGDCYSLYQCRQCGLVKTLPEPSPEALMEAYSQSYYGGGGNGGGETKFVTLIERWTRYSARKRAVALIKSHGVAGKKLRVLDIGCGRGVLLNAFEALGHDVVGVERKGSPFEGLPNIQCGDLADLNLESTSFDIVVLWHVLEHVSNPKIVINEVAKLISRTGSLFISVPNFGSRQAKVFKAAWFHLDLPRHLFHFTEFSLGNLLTASGLSIAAKNTFSLDQNAYGFLQSTLNMLPGLKNNHLYELLKGGLSIRLALWMLCYIPLVSIVSFGVIIELLVSQIQHCGASLTVKAVIKDD
jgi:SAM-dependent methyltransferase